MENVNALKKRTGETSSQSNHAMINLLDAANASLAYIEFDKKGIVLSASEHFLLWMGYKLDEIVGKHHRTFVEPHYATSPAYVQFWAALGKGKTQKGEFNNVTKAGKEVWLSGSYTPVLNDKGKLTKVTKLVSNITQAKKFEAELSFLKEEVKAQEEVLRQNLEEMQATQEAVDREMRKNKATLDGCVDAVITINRKGIIEYFNPAAEKLWGYSSAEMMGKTIQQLAPEADMRGHNEGFDRYSRTGEKKVIGIGREVKAQRKDGSVVDILLTLSEVKAGNDTLFTAFIKDITKQKEQEAEIKRMLEEAQENVQQMQVTQAEMAKRQAETSHLLQRFNLVTQTTTEGLWDMAVPDNLVFNDDTPFWWADRFRQMVGYTNEQDFPNRLDSWANLLHPDHKQETLAAFNAHLLDLSGQTPYDVEYQLKLKSGEYKWFRAVGRTLRDEQGKPMRVAGTLIDIQALKDLHAFQVELETKVSERTSEIEGLLTSSQQQAAELKTQQIELTGQMSALNNAAIVSEVDTKGYILAVNDEFCRLAKYSREELIGQKQSIVRHPDMPEALFRDLWSTIVTGKVWKGEIKNRAKDGTHYWVSATITPVLNEQGRPVKYIGVRFDVTEQKDQEEKIKKMLEEAQQQAETMKAQEEEMRQNVEEMTTTQEEMKRKDVQMTGQLSAINACMAYIEFDPQGYLIKANDLFLQLMEYRAEEIQGKHHRIFADSAYAQSPEYQQFWNQLGSGKVMKAEFKRFTKNGKEVWLSGTYTPVYNEKGEIEKIIKLASDVTYFNVGFQACTRFIDELKKGNLDAVMNLNGIRLEGDIAKVAKDLEDLSNTIRIIITEVNRVVNLAGNEGQLRERLKLAQVQGAWKDLGDSLNQLLSNIAEPVLEINRIVTAMSMGDLTQTFAMTATGDLADMSNALNIAIRNINKLMRGIEENSFTVASSSTQMLDKSESMKKSTTEVAAAITQMAEGAQEQALRTDESSKLVEDILKSSNEMGGKADIITKAAEKGQTSCNEGLRIIRAVVENMHEITRSADTTSTSIDVLTNRSEEISRTLNVITDIASQTNLLALNAAIEAARAGDAGRGFAVVAEEIRKLAEDSRRSAVEIERVVKDVQKDTTGATKAIDKMKTNVETGTKATKEAEAVFESIYTSSVDTLQLSKQVLSATQEQQKSIAVVVKNIEKIVVVAEETASGTQEVASSSRELNKSMNEVSETGRNLSEVANQLKSSIAQFKLS